jgi:serine/threonine protein kinase
MPAKHIALGEPAHEAERQGIRFLVESLPDSFTVYSNAWLVDGRGVVYELDTVVVAPHGLYVVELKCYQSKVFGTDFDWTIETRPPRTERNPLRLNRLTAQVLGTMLRRESFEAGRRWVEHFVFLPQSPFVDVRGRASNGRVHQKASIIGALQDSKTFTERSGRPELPPVDEETRRVLHKLLAGADPAKKPLHRIREYRLEGVRERTDRFVEYDAVYDFPGAEERQILRVYPLVAADPEEKKRAVELVRWETQVLGRIGHHKHILGARPPFEDEAGLCLPFEAFPGVTLATWADHHHRARELTGREGLKARIALFEKIADAIEHAHSQGIVHRLLAPEAVLLADRAVDPEIRVTGFDLAKQVRSDKTIALSTIHDERLRWAAPEVAQGFSSATALSDQFGLGLILGIILAGKPLFESTADLVRNNGRATRLTELNPNVPQSLDAAVQRMQQLRPAERFASVREAREAVRAAVEGRQVAAPLERPLDPEDIPGGCQLGADYTVVAKLGSGGLATVYAARHQITGTTRALKVARPDASAEEALDAEYRVLAELNHDAIVRAIDVSGSIVPNRRTLVMDRVKGDTVAKLLADGRDLDATTLRHWAEDLFSALEYLDQKKITHKDLKPDNLIAGADGLVVIDFSLVGQLPDALFIGTALYRDPALKIWDSAADRYAAALCLFELYAGRHPFDGQAPVPGQQPRIEADEFEAPGLASFFQKALSPRREDRYPSAPAMRQAFQEALGVKAAAAAAPDALAFQPDASSPLLPLSATTLSSLSVERLRLAAVHTQGDLVALRPEQLRNVSGLGKKKQKQILELRDQLIRRGVPPTETPAQPRRSLVPQLENDPTALGQLELPAALTETLQRAGYATIGKLAAATSADLTTLQGVGRGSVARIVERLQAFADRDRSAAEAVTLAAFWERATAPFEGHMARVLSETYGIHGTRRTQAEIGKEIGEGQPEVHRLLAEARRRLLCDQLAPVVEEVESQLKVQGGIARVTELGRLLEDRYPAEEGLHGTGFVRLVKWMGEPHLTYAKNPENDDEELLLGRGIPPEAIPTFLEKARELAAWPPKETDAVRRQLRGVLPEYDLDHIVLACKLVSDLRRTEAEELFESPVHALDAIEYVLRRERLPIPLSALMPAIQRAFGDAALLPPAEELPALVGRIADFRVEADQILAVQGQSLIPAAVAADPIPEELRVAAKSEETVAGELLRTAAQKRGFRLVVAPPGEHREIGLSIARALGDGATYVSFEEALLARLEPGFPSFEQAERFAAMRHRLAREAAATYQELLARHGQPGRRTILGDTGILGICNALDLIGRLYTETTIRDAGFWAVVIPGVIQHQAPLFNEKIPVANIPGMVLPVPRAIPA